MFEKKKPPGVSGDSVIRRRLLSPFCLPVDLVAIIGHDALDLARLVTESLLLLFDFGKVPLAGCSIGSLACTRIFGASELSSVKAVRLIEKFIVSIHVPPEHKAHF